MKKSIMGLLATLAAATMFVSCDSKAKLAEQLQGTWTGNPERLLDTGAAMASAVRMMEFSKGSTPTEGTVQMSALITVENAMPFNDSIQTPLTISASGIATITGLYQAKDNDELLVSLDNSSFNVSVDPEGVQLNYNVISESSGSTETALKPAAVMLATQQINKAAQQIFTNIGKIDDIHIDGNMMKCEIRDRDLVFVKETATGASTTRKL